MPWHITSLHQTRLDRRWQLSNLGGKDRGSTDATLVEGESTPHTQIVERKSTRSLLAVAIHAIEQNLPREMEKQSKA